MPKFTPGPWTILYKTNVMGGIDGWRGVANCAAHSDNHIADHWDAENAANANLISAAPEMYEVLKAMIEETVDYMTINKLGDPEKQHNIKWARAVLAKAEGKS